MSCLLYRSGHAQAGMPAAWPQHRSFRQETIQQAVYAAGRLMQSTVECITTGDISALPPEEAADKGDFAAIACEAVQSQRPLAGIISRGAAPFNLCEPAR